MNETQTVERAECVRRIVDVHVEVTPPSYAYGWDRDPEKIARRLQEWSSELVEFIRDHRSRDAIDLEVVKDVQDVCSVCGNQWETVDSDEYCQHTTCAHCGAIVGAREEEEPA